MANGTAIKRFLRAVDWVRVAHVGGLLLRELRGDADIEADHQRERTRGRSIKESYTKVAREVTGCDGSATCACAVCTEEREEKSR